MKRALALKPLLMHYSHTLPLIRIKTEVAKKKSSNPCLDMMLILHTCRMLRLEHEISKLKQDLEAEKRRSLGFEQDLEHIIDQVNVCA